jgi:hypothetical protein
MGHIEGVHGTADRIVLGHTEGARDPTDQLVPDYIKGVHDPTDQFDSGHAEGARESTDQFDMDHIEGVHDSTEQIAMGHFEGTRDSTDQLDSDHIEGVHDSTVQTDMDTGNKDSLEVPTEVKLHFFQAAGVAGFPEGSVTGAMDRPGPQLPVDAPLSLDTKSTAIGDACTVGTNEREAKHKARAAQEVLWRLDEFCDKLEAAALGPNLWDLPKATVAAWADELGRLAAQAARHIKIKEVRDMLIEARECMAVMEEEPQSDEEEDTGAMCQPRPQFLGGAHPMATQDLDACSAPAGPAHGL